MYVKITHIICFLFGHRWYPEDGQFAICRRCREIKVNLYGITTTLEGWAEWMKHG